MIHARQDYNRIQDPALEDPSLLGEGSQPIGKDEPVFLIRANDKHMEFILQKYLAQILRENGNNEDDPMAQNLIYHIERVRQWASTNGTKAPDMNPVDVVPL